MDEDSSNEEEDITRMRGTDDPTYLARDMMEGGHCAISFLLCKAIAATDILPDASNMQFRDIKWLDKPVQDEWYKACREELEDLHRREVYSLVELPAGRKAVANKWVFLIKPDGRK